MALRSRSQQSQTDKYLRQQKQFSGNNMASSSSFSPTAPGSRKQACLPVFLGITLTIAIVAINAFIPIVPSTNNGLRTAASTKSTPTATTKFELTSPAFVNGQAIPERFALHGSDETPDMEPPLEWTYDFKSNKNKVQSFVLIVDDPDAPDPAHPREEPWVHWIVYNIPPDTRSLTAENVDVALIGYNDWKQRHYNGPSPPIGNHRYFFTLYAVDTMLPTTGTYNKQDLLSAMHGHVLDQAELMGTYQAIL